MGDACIGKAKKIKWENYVKDPTIQDLVKQLKEAAKNTIKDSNELEEAERIKLVIVGDGAVGKTCLLVTYDTGNFPEDYVPTVFDNRTHETTYKSDPILLQLWDTAGQEDYDRLRPLSYPGSDIVILCFSLVSEGSYEAVAEKWHPEVNHYAKGVPQLLVGTKLDMREGKIMDESVGEFQPVSTASGKELAEDIGAVDYIECSAKTRQNLNKVFERAVEIVMTNRLKKSADKKKGKK